MSKARYAMKLVLLVILVGIRGGGSSNDAQDVPTSWKLLWLCPMPKPMPASYTVNRGVWSLLDSFRITVGSEELGQTARTFFSLAREIRLQTASGDSWGVVRMGFFSSYLDFFDCVGDLLVRFEGDWSWWGSTPSCKILDLDGAVLGRVVVSEKLSSADTKVVAVEDRNGHATAQLIQRNSWMSVHTSVHILVPPDRMRANATSALDPRVSPLDPLVDLRVLALFSSLRFGASTIFLEGLLFDVALVSVACLLLRCCMVAYGWRRSAAESSESASILEKKRDEALQALERIEADLARERAGCCTQAKSTSKEGSWNAGCCRPAKLCDKETGYFQFAASR